MKPKVLITRMIPDAGINLLKESCEVIISPHDRAMTREEFLSQAAEVDGILGLLDNKVDAEFFDRAPNIKGYANYAVGFDNIDVAEATRRKVPVSNTPDVLSVATAECAWALLFAVARKVIPAEKNMRSGQWPGWGPMQFIGTEVTGSTLGIVGAGRIGTAMGLMSKGFGMDVLYTTRSGRKNKELEEELDAKPATLDQILEQADFISIHAPLTPDTKHLFSAASFKKMKPSSFIINTGRGPVIKEDDLVQALKTGEIAGAGLDVYEFEPKMAAGLSELENVVVLPHIGSATTTARQNMSILAAENLLAMLDGRKPKTCLNPELFD